MLSRHQLDSHVAMARFYIQYLPAAVGGSSARMSGFGRSGLSGLDQGMRPPAVKRRRLSTAFSLSLRIHIHQPLYLRLQMQCARIDCAATRRLFPYPSQPRSPRHPSFLSLSFRSQTALFSLSPMDGDVRFFYTYLGVLLPALTSFAYTFLCVLCTNTYSFHLYSPSPPSPHIQFSMSLTLPNKALVGTSMYIRSTLQLVAERHHQNLIPHLRSRNVLRASCSYLLFSRRHHIKLDLDAVELLSTPYLPTFSRHFSHLPTRFRLLYPRGSRAQT